MVNNKYGKYKSTKQIKILSYVTYYFNNYFISIRLTKMSNVSA